MDVQLKLGAGIERERKELSETLSARPEEYFDTLRKELRGMTSSKELSLNDLTLEAAKSYLSAKGNESLERTTEQQERSMGELSRRNLRTSLGASVSEDAELLQRTQQAVELLCKASGYAGPPIKVEILESKAPVGVMHPGGTITLTTGLSEKVGSDEGLSGILAHEIVHQVNRDSTRLSAFEQARVGVIGSKAFAALTDEQKIAAATTLNSALNELNKDMETRADIDAVGILKKAGIDPEPFARAIEEVGGEIAQEGSYRTPQERARLIREEARRGDR